MKGSFTDILEKLAVDRALAPYESVSWQADDADKGVVCSAEVRANAYADTIEAEIQWMSGDNGDGTFKKIDQVLWCQAAPRNAGFWDIMAAKFRGKDYFNASYNWDEKLCKFFRAVVRDLKQGKVPDLDEIEKTEMHEGGVFGDRMGDGSGRNVKVNTQALLYDNKRGRGF